MDSQDGVIKLDPIAKLFIKDEWFYDVVIHKLYNLFVPPPEVVKIPRKQWRKCCYHIVMNVWFEVFIYGVTIFQGVALIYRLLRGNPLTKQEYITYAVLSFVLFLIYLGEFLLKVFAYSWIYIYKHGIKYYFKSYWNILEFVLLCLHVVVLILFILDFVSATQNIGTSEPALVLASLRLLRLVRLFKLLGSVYARFSVYVEQQNNKKKLLAHDTAYGHLIVEREIIENLDVMFESRDVKKVILAQIDKDRLVFVQLLSELAVTKPWIQVTSKTIMASALVRNYMYNGL